MQKKHVLFLAGFLLALNIFCWQEVFVLAGPHYLKVDFLSVGQGDSQFIQTPQGHKILIDGGPNAQVLEKLNSILPFWDKTIDVVILTHPEKDHMTGLLEVLRRYKVKYFLWTGIVKNDAEDRLLADLLEKAQKPEKNFLAALGQNDGTNVITVSSGDKIKSGSVVISVLYPFEDLAGKEAGKSSNDTCIVNRLVYGKNSFLFTCDIDSKAEKELAGFYNLKTDVLKVAHHGSKYSSSDLFLEAVKPEIAVIEVGKNSFGHPTQEVLKRLENFGIQIKRTDKDGDVKFLSDGKKIYFK
jgi:competence protein ComEC